jgi:hypothetical protein
MTHAPLNQALPGGRDDEPADDRRLQQLLRDLAAEAGESPRAHALQQRVLMQWQAAHPGAAAIATGGAGRARLVLAGRGRRRWLLGSGLLLGGAALALGLWLRQPDPALDELLQPDVLSQMAIGQM